MKCNDHFCPWVRHSQEGDRYMCLKCGLERNLNEANGFYIVLICIAIAVLLMLMTGCSWKQDNLPIKPPDISLAIAD